MLANMLKKEMRQFDEQGKKIECLLEKGINCYPQGSLIRQQKDEWELLVKKFQKSDQDEVMQAKVGMKNGNAIDNTPFEVSGSHMLEIEQMEQQAISSIKKRKLVNPFDQPSFDLHLSQPTPPTPESEVGATKETMINEAEKEKGAQLMVEEGREKNKNHVDEVKKSSKGTYVLCYKKCIVS